MTLTEYYDIICEKLGVDSGELTDKLRTTYLDAICEKLGIDVGALPDKIRTTYLEAICKNMGVDVNNLQDRLVITYLGAILEKKGVDVDAMPDRLLNTYLDAIVAVLGGDTGGSGGNTGGGGVDWSQYTHALYNGVRLPKLPEDALADCPYCFIRYNGTDYNLFMADCLWVHENGMAKAMSTSGKVYYRKYKAGSDAWTLEEHGGSASGIGWYASQGGWSIIFSSHDMPNGSLTATDIYFEGTDPVPTA